MSLPPLTRSRVEEAFQLNPGTLRKYASQYQNPFLALLMKIIGTDLVFEQARGIHVYDQKGAEYMDFLSGFGSLNLGHEPPAVLNVLRQVEGRPNFLQAALNPFSVCLAKALAEITPGGLSKSFFCNSGAEAVEAGIKLARIATGRQVLLSTQGAYHGKTFGALSVSGRDKYRVPFEPLLPLTERVPFNDAQALEARLSKQDVAGFIVEPIQGENGVIIPDSGYLKTAEQLCRKNRTLLIMDEVQTGLGRTGKMFCSQHEQVEPDILILSKSLSGGMIPIGAMVTRQEIWNRAYGNMNTALLHSSTFGGNTRACACALAALDEMEKLRLPEQAEIRGAQLIQGLRALSGRYRILNSVRGKGLMIGMSFHQIKGSQKITEGLVTIYIARKLLKRHRIISAFTLNNLNVLRIAPPLIVTAAQIDRFLNAMEDVLRSVENLRRFRLVA